jgi:hypothetical protein
VDKKWPKAFANLSSGSFNAHGPSEQTFLRRFFQKSGRYLKYLTACYGWTGNTGEG